VSVGAESFGRLWSQLEPIGRDPGTGGYRRYAWTREDLTLREWFAGEAAARGLDLSTDRAGNQWAWWGNPDAAVAAGNSGLVIGSHLDSVPDGGAFDGPLGVASSFAALDVLRHEGFSPSRPIAVAQFGDEEGARFGIACAGSRLITGALDADRARSLTDADGISMAEAITSAGGRPEDLGRDEQTLRRIGTFVELHVEQGRRLIHLGRPVAVGTSIWPHGRWRFDLAGQGNHAGTTGLADRHDPMLSLATILQTARALAEQGEVLATCGKLQVRPNGVNAIPSSVTGWLDARGADAEHVRALVDAFGDVVARHDGQFVQESWTDETFFSPGLTRRLSKLLDEAPLLPTGAGHDAGILANAGIETAMLYVRNPTGISHSPEEYAELSDCLEGVDALARTVQELAG
jgi:N-carbamoyl-L-amino-acid hydrolase